MNENRALYDKRVDNILSASKKDQKVVRFFPEVDLRNAHDGLTHIAKKQGINCLELGKGEYVVFLNRKQTAVKMFAPGNVVAHLKITGDQRIDPRIISLIPRFFNGSKINYSAALEAVLINEFKK